MPANRFAGSRLCVSNGHEITFRFVLRLFPIRDLADLPPASPDIGPAQ